MQKSTSYTCLGYVSSLGLPIEGRMEVEVVIPLSVDAPPYPTLPGYFHQATLSALMQPHSRATLL